MSSNSTQNQSNQEIDLGQMMHNIKVLYQGFLSKIFNVILYLKRNILYFILLIIIGIILGYFTEQKKTFRNEIIVNPNFGSVNYLYTKIELLNSRISQRDTIFLRENGIEYTEFISKIEVRPIIDVYKFIERNEQNFDLLKLMAEESSIDKVIQNKITSRNYPNHVIEFTSMKMQLNDKFATSLLNYLNNTEYYKKIQNRYLINHQIKLKENDKIINKIYDLINQFSDKTNSHQNEKLVYYNDNTQLNDIIKTQEQLIQENGRLQLELVTLDKVIKNLSVVQNIELKKSIFTSKKLFFPIIFIILFIVFNALKKFYKSQSAKLEKN
jgi:hypothetical protein